MGQVSDTTEVTEQHLEDIESLFVQTAEELWTTETMITLRRLAPSTLYFSDRPKREVGHMTSKHFVDMWAEGENSFADNPPNAVLSYLDPKHDFPADTVVVLRAPSLEGGNLIYMVDVLDGKLPRGAGPVALFIDPFGRPLSPVSLAGMNRRDRRRDRRGR